MWALRFLCARRQAQSAGQPVRLRVQEAQLRSSVRDDAQLDPGLVVQRETIDDVGAGAIIADHLDIATVATQPRHDLVERADAGDVPEMRRR